jgi:hypothetical protein
MQHRGMGSGLKLRPPLVDLHAPASKPVGHTAHTTRVEVGRISPPSSGKKGALPVVNVLPPLLDRASFSFEPIEPRTKTFRPRAATENGVNPKCNGRQSSADAGVLWNR